MAFLTSWSRSTAKVSEWHFCDMQSSSPETLGGADASAKLLPLCAKPFSPRKAAAVKLPSGLGHFVPAHVTKSAMFLSVSIFTAGAPHLLAPLARHLMLSLHTPLLPKTQEKAAAEQEPKAFGAHSAA
jgi:hypothetical protein